MKARGKDLIQRSILAPITYSRSQIIPYPSSLLTLPCILQNYQYICLYSDDGAFNRVTFSTSTHLRILPPFLGFPLQSSLQITRPKSRTPVFPRLVIEPALEGCRVLIASGVVDWWGRSGREVSFSQCVGDGGEFSLCFCGKGGRCDCGCGCGAFFRLKGMSVGVLGLERRCLIIWLLVSCFFHGFEVGFDFCYAWSAFVLAHGLVIAP